MTTRAEIILQLTSCDWRATISLRGTRNPTGPSQVSILCGGGLHGLHASKADDRMVEAQLLLSETI